MTQIPEEDIMASKEPEQDCPYCEESPPMEYEPGGMLRCPNCDGAKMC